jgi:hypothetical protein
MTPKWEPAFEIRLHLDTVASHVPGSHCVLGECASGWTSGCLPNRFLRQRFGKPSRRKNFPPWFRHCLDARLQSPKNHLRRFVRSRSASDTSLRLKAFL